MDDAELLRIRDRVLTLENGQRDIYRRYRERTRELDELRELVDTMTKQEELKHAVTAAIREERRTLYNVPRKAAGVVLALLVAFPAVHELAGWLTTL